MEGTASNQSGGHHVDAPAAMKIAISRYHKQLMEGCGRISCSNENCASSGKLGRLTSNEAAARAIACLRDKARLCEPLPENECPLDMATVEQMECLTEDRVREILEECRSSNDWGLMRLYLDHTLGNRDVLIRAFLKPAFAERVLKICDSNTPELRTSKFGCGGHEAPPDAPRKKRSRAAVESSPDAVLEEETTNSSVTRDEAMEVVRGGRNTGENRTRSATQPLSSPSQQSSEFQSGGSTATSASLLPSAHSSNLTRSASDLGATRLGQQHCSDCGWRNVVVEDKDAQTENMDVDSSLASSKKDTKENAQIKENDAALAELRSGNSPTDFEAARRCFAILFKETTDHKHYLQAAMGAIAQLCSDIDFQLQYDRAWQRNPSAMVHLLNIVFELPFLQWFEFIEVGFTPLCKMCANLCSEGQLTVASVWAELEPEWIQDRISLVQQAVTLRVLTVIDAVGSLPRFTDRIEPLPAAVQTLSILYKAVLIKSKRSAENVIPPDLLRLHELEKNGNEQIGNETMDTATDGPETGANSRQEARAPSFLEAFKANGGDDDEHEEVEEAGLRSVDAWTISSSRVALPLTEFLNATLSENLSVEDDFVAYKSFQNGHAFSVMPEFSFIISTEVKQRFLMLCNRVQQRTERRQALADSITYGFMLEPYLRLTVRRDHVVRDALDSLAAVAFDNVANFKKQLRVYFDGEHALDEGGVSKEFYQLITQELFCPDYGMFLANEKTGLYWFNSQCTFCDDEYSLIGLLFGLAIYNNILVDVRFPTVLYTKLLARPGTFEELDQLDPDLYNGLKELLKCEDDVENIYCYTFQISYKDAYGGVHTKDLVPNGGEMQVTNENKKEFVALYSDFLLNKVVQRQFEAFSAGFNKVANRKLLRRLCLPNEVEELVCGVLDLNFDLLAKCTRYQNGFTEESQTIKDFWTVAKEMSIDEKKMLLQFITGSDRAPVGGLAKLEVVIARNGDEKQRLPTAHTCYNVMLLPDYGDLEVTRERILKAISYSRGFGLQ